MDLELIFQLTPFQFYSQDVVFDRHLLTLNYDDLYKYSHFLIQNYISVGQRFFSAFVVKFKCNVKNLNLKGFIKNHLFIPFFNSIIPSFPCASRWLRIYGTIITGAQVFSKLG